MDLGQWATVDRWLARLPDEMFAAHPELNCSRADIAAVRGDMTTARRWFDCAASQYAKRDDLEGQCRSMLAGSAVAAEAGDLANALSRAHAASSLAGTADLSAIRMWAQWQVGRVSLAADDGEGALAAFSRAGSAAAARDLAAADPVRMTGDACHADRRVASTAGIAPRSAGRPEQGRARGSQPAGSRGPGSRAP